MPIDLTHGFRFGAFTAEPLKGYITGNDGQSRHLPPKAMDVLVRLAEVAPEPMIREDLINAVWGERYVSDEVLTHAIKELRHALGDTPNKPQYIQTIPKRGYQLLKTARPIADSAQIPAVAAHKRNSGIPVPFLSGFVALLLCAAAILFAYNKWWTSAPPEQSIAVLPFENMSADPEQVYFSDGISEELTNHLAKIRELRVASRVSAFSFRDKSLAIPTIAEALNVSYILDGSVRRTEDQLRITAQLIDADKDTHLWTGTYDRPMKDIFVIQDEISQAVVYALRITLLDPLPKTKTVDPEAYAHYFLGRYLVNVAPPHRDFVRARKEFERAIAIDKNYSPAWAGLSFVIGAGIANQTFDVDEWQVASDSLEEAYRLDPQDIGVLSQMASHSMRNGDPGPAVEYCKKTIELGPSMGANINNCSLLLNRLGKSELSLRLSTRFRNLNPDYWLGYTNRIEALTNAGRLLEAEALLAEAMSRWPDMLWLRIELANVFIKQDDPDSAIHLLEARPALNDSKIEVSMRQALLICANYALGRQSESDAKLESLLEEESTPLPTVVAQAYACRNEPDEAFEWLDRARALNPHTSYLYEFRDLDFAWRNLHGDPRWDDFLEQLGMSDRQLARIDWASFERMLDELGWT